MDPKVARKKEELLIRQGELSRQIALANKEIKKKGGEKLKELDEQISELEKIAGKAERVPSTVIIVRLPKLRIQKNGYRWIWEKREDYFRLHACLL